MKNLFLALAFLFMGSVGFSFEASEPAKNKEVEISLSTEEQIISVFYYDEESCTIRQGTQIESNGEITHQSLTVFHMDGISCETFFLLIMCGLNPAICNLIN